MTLASLSLISQTILWPWGVVWISLAGIVINRRAKSNHPARGSSYGNSTTHMSKLLPRLEGGAGGGCPILVFGIRAACYDPNA